MSTLSNAHAAIASIRLKVIDRPLAEIRPNPSNPRVHPKAQLRKLTASMRVFGCISPLLLDHDGQLVAGHARLEAARELGLTTVPTISLDHLSPAQAKALMIADNRLAELASWNDETLGEVLLDLSLLNLDVSLEVTGFDMGAIDLMIEDVQAAPKPSKANKADAAPPPAVGPAVSRLGDLWVLGRHRLVCGSALDAAAYDVLMGEGRAAMAFTDPPYNVKIKGHVSGLGTVSHREFPMASGEMSQVEFTRFLQGYMDQLVRVSAQGSMHFHCMDWRHLPEILEAGDASYQALKNLCVWVKDNAGMGSLYRSQHELVLVYRNGTAPHRNNVQLGKHGRNRTNVWNYPGVNSFARNSEEGNLLALHPTVKPVQLVADALLDCSARGEIVLDPFLGSGTTLMAAERVGRRCYGMELDPLYVDTIVRRWQAYTGDAARHAATGLSFAETADAGAPDRGGVS